MEIRALTVAEFAATRDLRRQAFGPVPDDEWERSLARVRPLVEAGRCLGGFLDGRVVATAHVNDQRQWWRGRALPLGGVSGVTVAPDLRGRGLARAVVRAVLDRCAELGLPLSMLVVTDGAAALERSADDADAVRLGPRGLAALYAGVPLATLRRAGLAAGGAAHDDALDAAFAADPFALDFF
ncbi:GNAT family N-acetyltransferase [Actinomadura atramentaria]|uniref:GNAT family N-acetyltransferase n=1 Tax=Actinomadura atramentaria TaxID=1990 RepID=UPI0004780E17|nr:GNAT family N-acetyltransferase [Actinomadura atramentaria]